MTVRVSDDSEGADEGEDESEDEGRSRVWDPPFVPPPPSFGRAIGAQPRSGGGQVATVLDRLARGLHESIQEVGGCPTVTPHRNLAHTPAHAPPHGYRRGATRSP